MRAASYFQLLVYSHRVTTAGSSACLLWQIFHAGCSNSDCAQRDGNNRVLKLSRTRQGLKGYAGRSELQHRWLCTSSVVKSSGEQWNELRIKITLYMFFHHSQLCIFGTTAALTQRKYFTPWQWEHAGGYRRKKAHVHNEQQQQAGLHRDNTAAMGPAGAWNKAHLCKTYKTVLHYLWIKLSGNGE